MPRQAPLAPGPPTGAPSDRSRLARLALETALTVPGVVRGEAGLGTPRVTVDPAGLVVGVAATAQGGGRYAIDLRLVARLVPLWPLADTVRVQVQRAAAQAGLSGALGSVDVEFADLLASEPGLIEPRVVAAPVGPHSCTGSVSATDATSPPRSGSSA